MGLSTKKRVLVAFSRLRQLEVRIPVDLDSFLALVNDVQ